MNRNLEKRRKPLFWGLLTFSLIIVGLLLFPPWKRIHKSTETPPPFQQSGRISVTPLPFRTNEPQSNQQILEIAPTAQQLREEVLKAPDTPPPSLIEFSQHVSVRMKQALPDKTLSNALMKEFDACTHHPELNATVQAVCLINAQRLSLVHATLLPEFERMRDQASPPVHSILQSLQR